MVQMPDGRIERVQSLEVDGQETSAVPWTGASQAIVEAGRRRIGGEGCSPRRFPPEREIVELLSDEKERSDEEIAEELGWSTADVRGVLTDQEEDLISESFNEETGESRFSLSERGREYAAEEPPFWEDRSQAGPAESREMEGSLRPGDIVESRWGPVQVRSISLCDPDTKDGPEVPLVPWMAGGGRDFAVTLSNGHWAWANQIRPRQGNLQEDVLRALRDKPLSREDLAEAVGVSERDLEETLDDLQFEDQSIRSDQVFTENDEFIVYSLV